MKKKHVFIAVVVGAVITTVLLWVLNNKNKTGKFSVDDMERIVSEYKLPSGLFTEVLEENTESDIISTALMCRINCIMGLAQELDVELLEKQISFDQQEAFYLCFLLKDVLSSRFKDSLSGFVSENIAETGLLQTKEDQEDNMLNTAYAIATITEERVSPYWKLLLTNKVKKELETICEETSLMQVWALLQIASTLKITFPEEKVLAYLETEVSKVSIEYETNHAIDSGRLYYLSYCFVLTGKEMVLSRELFEGLLWIVDQDYYSLPDLKNAAYVIVNSSFRDEGRSNVKFAINALNEKFRLNDGTFSRISTITPSWCATYCGNKLMERYKLNGYKNYNEVAASYVNQMLKTGRYMTCTPEEVYYMCAIAQEFGPEGMLNEYAEELTEYFCTWLMTYDDNSIRVRDIYCCFRAASTFGNPTKIMNAVSVKTKALLKNGKYEETMANICMLNECLYGTGSDERVPLQERVKITSVVDAYHYVRYNEVAGETESKVSRERVSKLLDRLGNPEGYYFSEEVKKNSLYLLYVGLLAEIGEA